MRIEQLLDPRTYYRLLSGWKDKSDRSWVIIDELGLYEDAYFYGRLDEETFVANYVASDTHHHAIEAIIKEYDKYVGVSGIVYEEVNQETKRSDGAALEFGVGISPAPFLCEFSAAIRKTCTRNLLAVKLSSIVHHGFGQAISPQFVNFLTTKRITQLAFFLMFPTQ